MLHRRSASPTRSSAASFTRVGTLSAAVVLAAALVLPIASATAAADPAPTVTDLVTNSLSPALGIRGDAPRLSWQLDADRRGVTQTAYRVRVATTVEGLEDPDVWDSGRVDSGQSLDVRYDGAELTSATRYHWSVKVWDDSGAESAWSEPAWFETGLLSTDEWTADWIGAEKADPVGAGWTDYTVEFTASGIDGALGVYLRGSDDDNAYMWQLNEAEGSLRPHVKQGGYRVLPSALFPSGFDWAAEHEYVITVDGSTIRLTVDGEMVDSRTDSTHTDPGVVGFRTSGSEQGFVHDLTVTSEDGEVLLDTDFTDGSNPFRAGTVTDDGLMVSGNAEAWLTVPDTLPLLRTEFEANDDIASARVYASAHGVYELRLNGEKVGDQELAPGWTDYRERIAYQTYDVTEQVRAGVNAFGAEVAPGWFSGRVAIFGPDQYGTETAVIAELHVTYADGSTQVVTTDDGWRVGDGPRTAADLLDGESYDARRAQAVAGWDTPGFDDDGWAAVAVREPTTDRLEAQRDQPVRATQELSAVRLDDPAEGTYVYDLGQNMVGKARVTVTGEPGQTVRVRHAEVLNPDGSVYTANLRGAAATDYYTLATDEPETFSPSFTFHGFRYVEITGVAAAPDASDVVGVVLGTDGELVSELSTSSELVNQLHSNIVWSQRGNFLSVPTDTPARDERMAWTGDINVFARTGVYNMDSQAFLARWLQDLRDTQRDDGALPGVAPVIPGQFDGGYGPAGWMDAGVNVPWTLWQAYGDTAVLRENYAMMTAYVDYLERDSTDGIRSAGGYLDWLNLDDPTPADVLDTAFVAKSARQLSQIAAVLGEQEDAQRYGELYDSVRAAYIDAFVAADGTVKGDSQTAYILTITNDLVPDDRQDEVGEQFAETLERRDYHLSTGFLGVDGLLPALTDIGRTDLAYRLLLTEDYPSWGYEIERGATTIWERWNSIMPDGSFGPVEMNSFNHYAYGAVGEWMYRTMAGVSAAAPGYREIRFAPEPDGSISDVDFSLETRYGTVTSAWRSTAAGIELDVEVPGNTTATVRVPAGSRWAVTESGIPAEEAESITFIEVDGGVVVYEVGSGSYSFATDAVLGDLGETTTELQQLDELVSTLVADGELGRGQGRLLQSQLARLVREVSSARSAHLAGGDASVGVGGALSTVSTLQRWVTSQQDAGRIGGAVGGPLQEALASVGQRLSRVSAQMVRATTTLEVDAREVLPGQVLTARVVLDNAGDDRLTQVASTLTAPPGWLVERVGTASATAAAGASVVHTYTVTVPAGQRAGNSSLDGTASYRHAAGTATLPVSSSVVVAPAVEIVDVSTTKMELAPGAGTEVTVLLHNRSSVTASGTLSLTGPSGWSAPEGTDYVLAAGEEREVTVTVGVPLSVTGGPAAIEVSTGTTAAERTAITVAVVFAAEPAVFVDHADLGSSASEQAHGLTASPSSGTNVEAGLTRRYTGAAQPGGWFEFDLAVPAGEAFLVRAVETYDSAQFKTYDVVMDGGVVHSRAHQRGEGGVGTVTYQFVVKPSQATADGTVRLRFQDTGADHDPSIADVWVVPAAGGLDVTG